MRSFDAKSEDDFQAVLAYEGAIAYVYLADRSGCRPSGSTCAWKDAPRFEDDVLPAADALFRANLARESGMTGALDLILLRRSSGPIEVYAGEGAVSPLADYLARHPHPSYPRLEERLAELTDGPGRERVGDLILIAHAGDRDTASERYYFAPPQHSGHGSPSIRDGAITLAIGHPGLSRASLEQLAKQALGPSPRLETAGDLLLALRRFERHQASSATLGTVSPIRTR